MDGTVGVTSPGNTKLVDYGIQNEESDIRAHVGVYAQCVYIFKTEAGKEAINPRKHRKVPVYTKGIRTSTGYLVPPSDIPGCQAIPIPTNIFARSKIGQYPERGYEGEKGRAAVHIVSEMLKCNLIPMKLRITEVDEQEKQIKGEDLQVETSVKIQIKCDYRAGSGHQRCTGNLFIQVQECNPWGIH